MVRSDFEYVHKLCEIGLPASLLASVLFDELKAFIAFDALTLLWREPGVATARAIHESHTDVQCRFVDAHAFERMFVCSATASLTVASQLPTCDWLGSLVAPKAQALTVYLANSSRPCGVIILHRTATRAFSVTEKATLVRVARVLSGTFSSAQPTVPLITSRAKAGIVLMDRNGNVVETCTYGRKLLQLANAADGSCSRAGNELRLSAALRNRVEVDDPLARSFVVISNPWGSFEFSSHSLPYDERDSNGRYAVMLYRREPLALRVLRNCRVFALTCKQMEVALLLVSGLSNDAVGARLHIRSTTVADHARKIYEKVGAANRRDLITALILGEMKAAGLWPARDRDRELDRDGSERRLQTALQPAE